MRRVTFILAIVTAMLIASTLWWRGGWSPEESSEKLELRVFLRNKTQFVKEAQRAEEEYKVLHPNVTLTFQFVPTRTWSEYISSFQNQIASGDPPDVVEIAIEGFAALAEPGLMADIAPLIKSDPVSEKLVREAESNLLKRLRDSATGEQTFFPLDWNNIVVYYNKDIFDRAGVAYPATDWRWSDFVEIAREITKNASSDDSTVYGYVVPGFNFGLTPWFLNNGTDKLDKNWRRSNARDPRFSETLLFLHGLIHEHAIAPTYEPLAVGIEQFVSGQVSMISAGRWVVPALEAAGMSNVGVVLPPTNIEANQTVYGIGGIGILKSSRHKELAWDFVRIFAGEAFQRQSLEHGEAIPLTPKFAYDPEFLRYPAGSEVFYDSAPIATPVASPRNFGQVQEIFERHVGAYLTNTTTLQETITNLDYELQRAMVRAYGE